MKEGGELSGLDRPLRRHDAAKIDHVVTPIAFAAVHFYKWLLRRESNDGSGPMSTGPRSIIVLPSTCTGRSCNLSRCAAIFIN